MITDIQGFHLIISLHLIDHIFVNFYLSVYDFTGFKITVA